MKKYWLVTFIFLMIVLMLALASKGHAQDETTIFLPAVERSAPAIYRLDTRLSLYSEGTHFTRTGKTHLFTSSTYYGYFAGASWAQDIESSGPKIYRVISFVVPSGSETVALEPYAQDYIFMQFLKTTTKITIYR